MNGIDNLTLYKTVDELQESKNSIERRTGIDFSKNVQQFDLLLDIIGEETPETEEKRQVEVVEQILEAVWPKNLFEAYCSDKDNIVQAVYSNMIAIVLFSLKYLLADEIIEDEYDSKLQRWLDMKSGEEEETFECYERMKRTVSNKIKKIAKNVRKSKDDYEQNLRLPIQLPQSTHKKKILKSLMKKIVELEANSAQENGADGKSDSKQKKRTNSISWNILKLAEKEENVANFKKINANEKRSIKKIYETLCREITEVSMRKVEDTDKAEKVMLELAYECVFHAKSISALEDGDGTEIDLLGRTIVPIGFYVRKFKFGNEEQCIGFRNIYCATLKSMMIYVVEYAGSVLQKKQKEISQKDKVVMAYEIVCNYVKSGYKEYYEAAFDEKNKIKLDLNAPNIGEHIWAVMNILFYCEKYNKENQYLCSIETEGVPYIRPEFPKVAKCNESKKCGKIKYKVPESKGKKLEIYFSVMTSDGILDEIKELNAIKVARENEVSRLREIFEENQKNEGDLFQKDILAFENWEKGFSLSDFRVEIFSDDKFTLVISGKQSPNIMKSILTACGMKVDGRTKKISANQMTLITLCQVMDKAEIMCDPWAERTVLKVRLGKLNLGGLMNFELGIEKRTVLTNRDKIARDSFEKYNLLETSDTSKKIRN